MTTPTLFVDTNVFMYAVGADHPLKAPCVSLLEAVARGRAHAVTSVEVLQEILHRYSALGMRERAVDVSSSLLELVPEVLAVTRDDIAATVALHREHGSVPSRDIVIVASMRRQGIDHIVSADRHFDRFRDIIRIDPTDIPALLAT